MFFEKTVNSIQHTEPLSIEVEWSLATIFPKNKMYNRFSHYSLHFTNNLHPTKFSRTWRRFSYPKVWWFVPRNLFPPVSRQRKAPTAPCRRSPHRWFSWGYSALKTNEATVDGRNPKQPPGMVLKPCKWWDKITDLNWCKISSINGMMDDARTTFFLMKLEGIFQLISRCKTYERIRRNFWVGNAGETYHYPNLVKHDVNSPFTWHVFDNFTVVRGLKLLLYFLQHVQNHNYEISIRSTRVHDLLHLHMCQGLNSLYWGWSSHL